MLHIWKYLREVIVIVGICGEIKQRKTTSQIGIPIRIIQWRLNVEKTVFTLCLHTPSQYFDKLLSMRVCGYGDFVQVRPPAVWHEEESRLVCCCSGFFFFVIWYNSGYRICGYNLVLIVQMSIDIHGGGNITVSQPFLNCFHVYTAVI